MSLTTVGYAPAGEGAARLPTVRLVYAGGEGILAGRSRLVTEKGLQIGRSAEGPSDLCIADDVRASRVHAKITRCAGGLRVQDAGSRNGTFVNGKRVSEATLSDGDVCRIGDSLLIARWEDADEDDPDNPHLVGVSPALRHLRGTVALVGPTPATVVLLGETGTGKEVSARALHDASGRGGAFVPVNCTAIPETLAESQLFGHVAGAFTGAQRDQDGFFRAAEGGTLFLDEIGDLPKAVQPKLLRALDERQVWPVGRTSAVPVDIRVIAATNVDLDRAMESGDFRADLYARLADIVIELPPLVDRREDILLLLRHALNGKHPPLEPDLADALLRHHWPFNVREVRKVATELSVRGGDLPRWSRSLVAKRFAVQQPAAGEAPAVAPNARGAAWTPTRDELEALCRESGGRVVQVARLTGRSRSQVYRWLEQHSLDIADFRV